MEIKPMPLESSTPWPLVRFIMVFLFVEYGRDANQYTPFKKES
jgi:hypothetical protein